MDFQKKIVSVKMEWFFTSESEKKDPELEENNIK